MKRVADGLASFAAGILLALAFPEVDIAPLAWFAPAVFLFFLKGAGAKRGAFLGGLFGIGFFGLLIYWISIVGVLAWVFLVLLSSLFFMAFGALWGWASREARLAVSLVIPAAGWVVLEFARSVLPLRGFTWGHLAQSQHDLGSMLRPAWYGGGWLVAGLIILMNAAIAEAARRLRDNQRRPAAALAAIATAVPLLSGSLPTQVADGPAVTAAIVQGNIPRYQEPSYEKDRAILDNHVGLTEKLPADVDLVLWPESSIGIDPFRDGQVAAAVLNAARAAGAPMIVGGNLDRDDGDYQVMAYLISPEGEFIDRYQKTHLVPFGEFVPNRDALDWIPALDQVPRDAVPGTEGTLFEVAGGTVAPVISYEGDFGSLVSSRVGAGGRLVVVATNTSTWEDSPASAQHVAMSQVRAAENGTFVLHGALTGISAVIDPSGRILDRTELWESDTLIRTVNFSEEASFYARAGDWLPRLCMVVCGVYLLLTGIKRRRGSVTT